MSRYGMIGIISQFFFSLFAAISENTPSEL